MTARIVVVDTARGLFVRSSPGGDVVQLDGRPLVRKQGFRIAVQAREYAVGRWWVGGGSHWYAEEYTRPYQRGPAGDQQVESPVPGYRVTTPYGRRKPGLWRTKGYHTGDDYSAQDHRGHSDSWWAEDRRPAW